MLPAGFGPALLPVFFHLAIKSFEINRKGSVLDRARRGERNLCI